jgi:hypothetical protein
MKITPIKIAAAAIVLISLSLASCKSAGYGCDYGAVEPANLNIPGLEICLDSKAAEEGLSISYIKIEDVSE